MNLSKSRVLIKTYDMTEKAVLTQNGLILCEIGHIIICKMTNTVI